jgi:hypothetical protein
VTDINPGRWTADVDEVVVFLIGARFNRKTRILSSLRDLRSTRGRALWKMCDHLMAHPDRGLLGYEVLGPTTMVQYWRSFDDLERFAKDRDDPHLDAWRTYWKRVGRSDRTGIWHETYVVRRGDYEVVYGNMPSFGLAKATRAVPVAEARQARDRMGVPATA